MHCLHMLRSHARMQHFYTPNKGVHRQMCETFRKREYEITMARSSDSKNKVEEDLEKRLKKSKFAYVADQQIKAIRNNLDAL